MAEIEYDPTLGQTSDSLEGVDWDGIEAGGLVAEGKHLCVVKKIGFYLHNFETYTGPRAKVLLEVADGPEKGKALHDNITLPHPKENSHARNRRLLIGMRMGLIPRESKGAVNVDWNKLAGKKAAITVVHRKGTGDKANQTYANVDFNGWESPDAITTTTTKAEPPQYADI